MYRMICPHPTCGKEWTPRKPNPAKCPTCQNPLWRRPVERRWVEVATPRQPAPAKRRRAVCRYSRPNQQKLMQKLAYYGGRCRYCQIEFSATVELTWDHAIPVSRGGTDAIANLLPSCKPCNGKKYNRTFAELARMRDWVA